MVIAIIAILAAILFSAFAKAREKARQTSCLSNEKQIGPGLLQYTQNYDEKFPAGALALPPMNAAGHAGNYSGNNPSTGAGMGWAAETSPYIKQPDLSRAE